MGKMLEILFTLDIPILMLYVYLVKGATNVVPFLPTIERFEIYFLGGYYMILVWLWGKLLLFMTPKVCSTKSIEKGAIKSTDVLSDNYILKVISLFLVALRLHDVSMFIIFTSFIYILTKNATLNIFSPILTLHGFKFYSFRRNGVKCTLATKLCLRDPKYIMFEKLYRINKYTYIHLEDR
ncbi:MAG: hypothetical protein ACRCZ0_08210 [Cetobacterium sp.]